MPVEAPEVRNFRRRWVAGILLAFALWIAWKAWHLSVAFEAWSPEDAIVAPDAAS